MEKEVLTIPAGKTIDMIYRHKIHAYPHPRSYYNAPFVAFRRKGGFVNSLFTVQKKIVLDPKLTDFNQYIKDLSPEVQQRLEAYIEERKQSKFGFEKPDQQYMFWILEEVAKLSHSPKIVPNTPGHMYFAKEQVMGCQVISNS